MESLQTIKSRQKAVGNISKITKAMEVVAATKMRKSQEIALSSRPYAWKALQLLEKISKNISSPSGFLEKREIKNTIFVIIASDRGLAGSFNNQVLRRAEEFIKGDKFYGGGEGDGHKFFIAAVGKKTIEFASRIFRENAEKFEIVEKFSGFGDFIRPEEVDGLARFLLKGYEEKRWDRAFFISMHFRTALKQEPLIRQILPLDPLKIKEIISEIVPEKGRYSEVGGSIQKQDLMSKNVEYILEPSFNEAIEEISRHLIKTQIYHIILEANASEHSARRVAMKNASENAEDLSWNLGISYNKARQAGITNEIIEITGTQNALA